jgi:hypothetical protein
MPKQKTRRSAAKRFSLTGTGKIKETRQTIAICSYGAVIAQNAK